MMKLIYGALILMLFSAVFLFSKEKEEHPCKQSLTGIVREINDATGHHLCIETPDHKTYFPQIEKDDVVITAGSRVKVCYDPIVNGSDPVLIRINHVSYLP